MPESELGGVGSCFGAEGFPVVPQIIAQTSVQSDGHDGGHGVVGHVGGRPEDVGHVGPRPVGIRDWSEGVGAHPETSVLVHRDTESLQTLLKVPAVRVTTTGVMVMLGMSS